MKTIGFSDTSTKRKNSINPVTFLKQYLNKNWSYLEILCTFGRLNFWTIKNFGRFYFRTPFGRDIKNEGRHFESAFGLR